MENGDYVNFVLSLIAVLMLLYALLWSVKKFGLTQVSMRSSTRRLKLLEVLPIDHKKRIILVQKDDTEYTFFVGESNELLISEGPAQNNSVPHQKSVKSKSNDSKKK